MQMRFSFLCVLGLFAYSPLAAAADEGLPAAALLPHDGIAFYQFDGMSSHRDAYQRTVASRVLSEAFGPLFDDLTARLLNQLGPQVLSEKLLAGADPSDLLQLQSAQMELPHLKDYLIDHGFLLAVEIIDPLQQRVQVSIVFPGAGRSDHRAAIIGGFRLIGILDDVPVHESQSDGELVLTIGSDAEHQPRAVLRRHGDHMLLTVGTEDAGYSAQLASGARPNLTSNPVYERLAAFDAYETLHRGFVDVERAAAIAEGVFPPSGTILQQLGLKGLKQFSFHGGFQGDKLRSTFVLRMPGEREGLLRLLSTESELELQTLPKLPPDATAVHVSRFNLETLYDAVIDGIEVGASVGGPEAVTQFQEAVERAEAALGFDLRADLFAALGTTALVYNAPSEGPFSLGTAVAVRVTDPGKVRNSLKQLIQTLPATTGVEWRLRERDYRGTMLSTIEVATTGFGIAPTYAVTDDGWLVTALYPQPVQGFIYRNSGDHAAWQQPAVMEETLAKVRSQSGSRVVAVSVNDPRAGFSHALSLAPAIVKLFSSFSGAAGSFDVALIPPAQSVTEPLTHNVTVIVDDGESLRWESYSSLPMPFQLNGIEFYFFAGFFSYFSVLAL